MHPARRLHRTNGVEVRLERPININDRRQGARDLQRYDYFKDVVRLERAVAQGLVDRGFAVTLTNDSHYWRDPKPSRRPGTDPYFRIHHGQTLAGIRRWGETAGKGTTKNREEPLELSGQYEMLWQPYSSADKSEFKFLCVEVGP